MPTERKTGVLTRIIYIIIQCAWGAPQSLCGLILLLLLGKQKRGVYRCAVLTQYSPSTLPRFFRNLASVSLGMFIFVNRGENPRPEAVSAVASHEYGHTIQSLLLGPLYLPLVGLPSFLWCRRYSKHRAAYASRGISYYSRYPEKQATKLGERVGEKKGR